MSARYVSTRGTTLPSEQGIYGRIENQGLARDFYHISPTKNKMKEFNKNWVKNATSVINFGDENQINNYASLNSGSPLANQ